MRVLMAHVSIRAIAGPTPNVMSLIIILRAYVCQAIPEILSWNASSVSACSFLIFATAKLIKYLKSFFSHRLLCIIHLDYLFQLTASPTVSAITRLLATMANVSIPASWTTNAPSMQNVMERIIAQLVVVVQVTTVILRFTARGSSVTRTTTVPTILHVTTVAA